jgi:peptide/nickel transport system ATP-binding protein
MSPIDATPLLDVEQLVCRYPVSRGLIASFMRKPRLAVHAVDGVSLRVHRGELVALVGESGSGKTTTALTILRLLEPTSGSIALGETAIAGLSRRAMRPLRRRVQIIYQDPYGSLDPRFRVRRTIEEPLIVHRIGGSRALRREAVLRALERVDLRPPELYVDRYPHELSGGQRQRVAIAASLVLEPELLVADEPVSMLDVSVRAGVLRLLDGLRRDGRLGILMITHDLATAAQFADRIAVMYLGRIVEEGPSSEVIRAPQHPYTKALISVVPRRDPRHRGHPVILRGETPNPVNVPSGCRFHPRCPVAQERCKVLDPQLRAVKVARSSDHRAACILVD